MFSTLLTRIRYPNHSGHSIRPTLAVTGTLTITPHTVTPSSGGILRRHDRPTCLIENVHRFGLSNPRQNLGERDEDGDGDRVLGAVPLLLR